jgi:hypothetical protein
LTRKELCGGRKVEETRHRQHAEAEGHGESMAIQITRLCVFLTFLHMVFGSKYYPQSSLGLRWEKGFGGGQQQQQQEEEQEEEEEEEQEEEQEEEEEAWSEMACDGRWRGRWMVCAAARKTHSF